MKQGFDCGSVCVRFLLPLVLPREESDSESGSGREDGKFFEAVVVLAAVVPEATVPAARGPGRGPARGRCDPATDCRAMGVDTDAGNCFGRHGGNCLIAHNELGNLPTSGWYTAADTHTELRPQVRAGTLQQW